MPTQENLLAELSRDQLLEKLEKLELRYKGFFNNPLVTMMTFDTVNGRISNANEKCMSLFGIKSFNSVNFYSFLRNSERHRVELALTKSGSIDSMELELRIEGKSVWVSCSAKINTDNITADCILQDITESKQSLIELQKVNFELDSFVYHASHDLRSPLRSILGLIDIYRLESSHKTQLECIEKIEGSVKRLDDLVMELLSISRNDRVNDPHVPINLMYEINNSVSSYYNASDTRGLEIRVEVRQPEDYVSDLTRVRIILNNLISNAIKYRSFDADKSYILIKAIIDRRKVKLTVEDNGEGIEQSKLPHIFDMFYRATERSEGSGLGLYIVKKVADKLNASIEVESYELEGTTFTVIIPNSNSNTRVNT